MSKVTKGGHSDTVTFTKVQRHVFSLGSHQMDDRGIQGEVVTSGIRLGSHVTDVLRFQVFADVQESKDQKCLYFGSWIFLRCFQLHSHLGYTNLEF